jgi:MoCo/4Fe-4S cofactor protein with predicted Tat translocation signal
LLGVPSVSDLNSWRSLAELEGDAAAEAFRDGEFPVGADLPPDAVTRRDFMTLLGATLSLAGLTACRRPEESIVPYVEAPESITPGVPRQYATTMPWGTGAYGLVVESHEGRPTKIEGNELHPATLGSSSARVQAAILDLYDPDRSQSVLKGGEKSTWADFVGAWKELAKTLDGDQGAGLAVLTEPFASPTLFRLQTAFRQRWPRARWIAHTAVSEQSVHEGVTRATGQALLPVHRLEKARVVLALDSDFLLSDPEMIRHTRGFAAARRLARETDEMARLYAVEGVHTVTGANADHRLRLSTRLLPSFLAALLGELAQGGLALGAAGGSLPPGVPAAFLKSLAADLLAHRGASLVIAGPRQPAAVHAAVVALNAALGNVGPCVTYHEPKDALLPVRDGLAQVVGAMRSGEVKTVVVMGPNPAYDAPADLEFVEALKSVQLVHVGTHVDETGALAAWHVPGTHFLEAWGDARAAGGTLSVVQPLIAPLFGGKSVVEVAHLLATGEDKAGYEVVRETWKVGGSLGAGVGAGAPGGSDAAGSVAPASSPAGSMPSSTPLAGGPAATGSPAASAWNRVLHDGLLAGSELPAVAVSVAAGIAEDLAREAQALAAAPAGIELVIAACPKLHDGRSANSGWLQELPDPMTKVTWDNPLLLSPETARAQGLTDGDVVRVDTGGRTLELPVFRVPGMADGTAVATLGYGRSKAGRVGNGVGANAYLLRTTKALDLAPATVKATGARVQLSQTQDHASMEGRPMVREANLAHYRERPGFATEDKIENPPLFSLWKEHTYEQGHQWGMAIDLSSCTGCNACAVACQSENNVPVVGKEQVRRGREMAWIRIDRYFKGSPAEPAVAFQPVPCMHCENAPCEQVCPVAATVHDGEGLNVMVYNRCIGTRYCSNNCPYKVRRFNFFNFTKDTPETLKMANNPDVTVRARGVMEKCTYCVQRVSRGKIEAKLAGRALKDGDIRTACQQACPAQAITFGDLRDPKSEVVQMKAKNRNYALLAELNTKPRTTYLAKIRNPSGAVPQAAHEDKGHG